MSSITISGDTSGAVSIAAPAIAGTNTMTLVAGTGSLAPKVLSTAVASTSGTSIDFTNIPSWVTRVTVMLSDVSTSGTANWIVQLGSGTVTTSGYLSASSQLNLGGAGVITSTSGFAIYTSNASLRFSGAMVVYNINSNTWVSSHSFGDGTNAVTASGGGNVSLSGTLDRVRITTVGGTNTFDAGTVNIMYE